MRCLSKIPVFPLPHNPSEYSETLNSFSSLLWRLAYSKPHRRSAGHCSNLTGPLLLVILTLPFILHEGVSYRILKFKSDHSTSHLKPDKEFPMALTKKCMQVLVAHLLLQPHFILCSTFPLSSRKKLFPMMERDICFSFCLKYSPSRYLHDQLILTSRAKIKDHPQW